MQDDDSPDNVEDDNGNYLNTDDVDDGYEGDSDNDCIRSVGDGEYRGSA